MYFHALAKSFSFKMRKNKLSKKKKKKRSLLREVQRSLIKGQPWSLAKLEEPGKRKRGAADTKIHIHFANKIDSLATSTFVPYSS